MSKVFMHEIPATVVNFCREKYRTYEGLCFTAEEENATLSLKSAGTPDTIYIQTSTDGNNWSSYMMGDEITLEKAGDKVYFRADPQNITGKFSKGIANCYYFDINNGNIQASGNIMSLVDPDCKSSIIKNTYQFCKLFFNCKKMTALPQLQATTLAVCCYQYMFLGCTAISQAPELPATALVFGCYNGMFDGCTSLIKTPALPATTLGMQCYSNMFNGCTSLVQATQLPATTLTNDCYSKMFYGCTSLKISENTEGGDIVLKLPSATEIKTGWNTAMFSNTAGTFTGNPSIGNTYRCYS